MSPVLPAGVHMFSSAVQDEASFWYWANKPPVTISETWVATGDYDKVMLKLVESGVLERHIAVMECDERCEGVLHLDDDRGRRGFHYRFTPEHRMARALRFAK